MQTSASKTKDPGGALAEWKALTPCEGIHSRYCKALYEANKTGVWAAFLFPSSVYISSVNVSKL